MTGKRLRRMTTPPIRMKELALGLRVSNQLPAGRDMQRALQELVPPYNALGVPSSIRLIVSSNTLELGI
jgi:hypothetical protein